MANVSTAGHLRPTAPLHTAPSWLVRVVHTTDELSPLVARVALGLVMFPHGAQKVLGWFGGYGLSATMHGMTTKMGVPAPFAALAIAAEFLGAIGLVTGTLTRVAAFAVGFEMLVAAVMMHLKTGFFMNWTGAQAGEGFEYHILAIGLALVIMMKGAGRASIDRVIEHSLEARRS